MGKVEIDGSNITYSGVTANLQDQTLTIGNTTLQRSYQETSITPYWLEPIGDTGIYTTPNEAVDPTDCDRYPNSPWCGGDLANWNDIRDLNPLSVEGNVAVGNQEICATFGATLFGIGLAPYTVCYRSSNAPPIQPPPVPAPTEPTATNYDYIPLDGYASRNPACTYAVTFQFYGATRPDYLGNRQQILDIPQTVYTSGLPMGMIIWRPYNVATAGWRMYLVVESPNGTILQGWYSNGYGYYVEDGETKPLPPPFITSATPVGNCPPRATTQPHHIPYYPENMTCDCTEITNLLRLIAFRLGCDQYPVQVPVNVADTSDTHEEHQSLTTLLGWVFKQLDAISGQYPVTIKVKDIDPTTEGDQEKEIHIQNASEALAELYGLQLRSSVNSDVLIEMLLRMSSEMMAVKNSSLITQDYVRANADFLGYKGNPANRKIKSAFDVDQLGDISKFLKESEKTIIGWKNEDKDSLMDYQRRLMFAAGIIKAVFWRSKSEAQKLVNSFTQYLDPDSDYNREKDEKFDEWIRELNREDSQFNQNSPFLPEINKITPQEPGENNADNQSQSNQPSG